MIRTLRALLIATVFAAGLGAPALAYETRAGDQVTLERDTTTSGTYYAAGSVVDIDGTINGDLVCAAERVTIRGTVNGDVLCAARDITINGRVSGNVRAAAQSVVVAGEAGRNVQVLAQTTTLTPSGVVAGELMTQSQTVNLLGTVRGESYGSAERVDLNGAVEGPVRFAASQLSVGDRARLTGGLEYTSTQTARIDEAAQITGEPKRNEPPAGPTASERLHALLVGWIISLLSAILLALALAWLFPRLAARRADDLRRRPGSTALLGLALLVLTPIAALLVAVTLIGAPLSVLALIGWGVAWYLSRVVAALAVGRLLYPRLFDGDGAARPYRQAVVGVLVTWLIFLVPYLGAFASFLATIIGAGLILRGIIDYLDRPDSPRRHKRPAPTA